MRALTSDFYSHLDCGSSTSQKINDQYDESNNQQQVNQTTRHMKTETEKPQHQQNHEDSPKHRASFNRKQVKRSQCSVQYNDCCT
jgi:hypothetical protein